MQSICLKEAGVSTPLAEETTLVGYTFGGYLRSKVVSYLSLLKPPPKKKKTFIKGERVDFPQYLNLLPANYR